MADRVQWSDNHMEKSDDAHLGIMSLDNVAKARAFHKSFPQYTVTPLARLDNLAARLGLNNLCVKDESYRFGLNAFKVLGGSFAMASYIADETGRDVSDMTYDYLTSDELARDFGQATFFTATDGNHGRGVAWAAKRLGQKAVVHMPKGSTKPRFDNIAAEGATVTIEEVNYDECVRMAAAEADACERGVIVQDTAWEGYEKIPSLIMEGYGTMASEAAEQLREAAINRPTHVFVQAGVGSLAGAVVGYFANLYPDNPPHVRGYGGHQRRMPVQGRCRGRWRASHRDRRHAHHHGRPVLRRAQHAWLGHPAQPRHRFCGLPRLGRRTRHANPGSTREGRSPRHLRRVGSRGRGPHLHAHDG